MTQLLHTGDTHIGYQQYHSTERRRDFLRAFERVIDDAIDLDVDAVVHSGDLFQDRRPDLQDIQGVIATLRRLRDANIPFLAIVGNHEEKREQQWLDLLADLGLAERLGMEPRIIGEIALYGLDYVPPSARDDLTYEFSPVEREDVSYTTLVAHGLFEPFAVGDWDTEHLLAESPVEFDALLLGDNHDPGTEQLNDTWLTYPGSTERASAAEREPRGYNLITTEEELRISRRTIETRPFVFVDVELTAGEGGEYVRERVREHDHENAVTIITIEGDGEPVTPGPIEELALDAGALIARVNDRRELETETTAMDVHFADPDQAVRAKLQDQQLSQAARDIDRTVRDLEVPDSNVRDQIRERMEEYLTTDPTALQASTETTTESPNGEDDSQDSTTAANDDDESTQQTTDTAEDGTATASNSEEPTAVERDTNSDVESDADDEQLTGSTEEQRSMEDFL